MNLTPANAQPATDARAELIAAAAKTGWQDFPAFLDDPGPTRPSVDAVSSLLLAYYRDVVTEDLAERGPAAMAAAVQAHLHLAKQREPGQTLLATLPGPDDRTGLPVSVIEVVTDDMAFLVDSVAAELDRLGHPARMVIHPQLGVLRTAAGQFQTVPIAADSSPSPSIRESWMRLEIDPVTASEAQHLTSQIQRVLDDVRRAHQDHDAMAQQAHLIADRLIQSPPTGVPEAEVADAVVLLQWLSDSGFIFLGYRCYNLDGDRLVAQPATGLGILRANGETAGGRRLVGRAAAMAREPQLMIVTKANALSTVHRPTPLDYISVKTFTESGEVRGEQRFLGLFADDTARTPIDNIPVLRKKAAAVLRHASFTPGSRLARELHSALESHPRDELFLADTSTLADTLVAITQLRDRPRTRLFMTDDPYGRFTSCLVYLPRDQYSPATVAQATDFLRTRLHGSSTTCTTTLGDSPVARLHIVVKTPDPSLDHPAPADLEPGLARAIRRWDDQLLSLHTPGATDRTPTEFLRDRRELATWASQLPEVYKQTYTPADALVDFGRIQNLEQCLFACQVNDSDQSRLRLKVYSVQPIELSELLPIVNNLDVTVVDERPFEIRTTDGGCHWIYDFGLRPSSGVRTDSIDFGLFVAALARIWSGQSESDALDGLVLRAGLTNAQVVILRCVVRYLKQSTLPYSQQYLEQALLQHPELSGVLVQLFQTRFDPAIASASDPAQVLDRLDRGLEQVTSLDHDRIIRAVSEVILACQRTNFYVHDRTAIALKLQPSQISHLPQPRPAIETWVYSPRVEGIHLRFGKIARGGLRWSDRPDDFRTEILGLVKAQAVKNAVIVPGGAKGGFVAKQLPNPALGRAAWLSEGRAAYSEFITALLEISDNRQADHVIQPTNVICHDDEDPYLVVAADKGTADFSDLANSLAVGKGFWLDDAFASGGSSGFSHKGMGITARGAWESVKRHFLELGIDTQSQPFTVVGIGDMSGDVFGNGMLCSEQIRLVAAFDHRHIFIDPDPDPATSYAERKRLFGLPQSSWAEYRPELISVGGGIFERTAKSIPISDETARALGLSNQQHHLTPAELIHCLLQAPVDLLWNGGIGTYVKATGQTHADIGDKANDSIRVDAKQLQCRVVGEGGNLGLSQLGRVEAALVGIRVNTDAIDNSAGVDTSDHEVNIKIFLNTELANQRLTRDERDTALVAMTDEVAIKVLRHNYEQNILLSNARSQSPHMVGAHIRLIHWLEQRGDLDRQLESLPDDDVLLARASAGSGLTSPEFSVLVAHTKLAIKAELEGSSLLQDPSIQPALIDYFPTAMQQRYGDRLLTHPLSEQIIINEVVGSLVNRGGINFLHRAIEQTNATTEEVVSAFLIARDLFDLHPFVAAVEQLDGRIPAVAQSELYLSFRRLLDGAVRWLLRNTHPGTSINSEIVRYKPHLTALADNLNQILTPNQAEQITTQAQSQVAIGLPAELATWAASLGKRSHLLDIAKIATQTDQDASEIGRLYFATFEDLQIEELLQRVRDLDHENRWDALLRRGLRDDALDNLARITHLTVLATSEGGQPASRLLHWIDSTQGSAAALEALTDALRNTDNPPVRLTVAIRALTSIAAGPN